MGLYFERGNRRALVVPDGMVVFGVDDHPDLSYKLWEHPKAPDLVLEVLSKYTWRKDVYDKPALYHDLGVREYWLFDPQGRRRDGGGALEGWRRSRSGVWEAAAPAGDGFVSEVLGLELLARDAELRFRERGALDVLPDAVEISRRWEQEAARADAAERRIAELEARPRNAERD